MASIDEMVWEINSELAGRGWRLERVEPSKPATAAKRRGLAGLIGSVAAFLRGEYRTPELEPDCKGLYACVQAAEDAKRKPVWAPYISVKISALNGRAPVNEYWMRHVRFVPNGVELVKVAEAGACETVPYADFMRALPTFTAQFATRLRDW